MAKAPGPTAHTFPGIALSPRKTAAVLQRSLDEKLGVLHPLRFSDIVLTDRLSESFPQRLEFKDRQPLISFLLFCTGVHNALPRTARF